MNERTDPQTLCPKVLVLAEDGDLRFLLAQALQADGWRVFAAANLKSGLIEANAREPDLIILSLVWREGDGLHYLHDLRVWSLVPVLALAARDLESDKIAALDAGADDCLSKPFSIAELTARARSSQRRWKLRSNPNNPMAKAVSNPVMIGAISVDLTSRRVTREGQLVALTPIEYRILVLLIRNLGRVVLHRQLLTTIWGPSHADDRQYLRVYIAGLRKKLERDPKAPRHLLTESSVGYRLIR